MFGLRAQSDSVLYGVIIDVGSSSVGMAIIASDRSKDLPTTVFSHRVHMRGTEKEQPIRERLRHMRETLFAASLILSKDGIQALTAYEPKARISRVLVSSSSPWAYTIQRNIRYTSDEPTKVTETLIEDLIAGAEDDLEAHIKSINLPTELGFKIVERATVDIRINDYLVHKPVGLKGESLSLTHITGLVPKDVIEGVSEVTEKIFPSAHLSTHTAMLVTFCVLRDAHPELKTFCLLSISGETTEFGLVENGTLVRTIFAPYGLHTLVRSMIEAKGTTPADVRSTLQAYAAHELDDVTVHDVDTHLTNYLEVIKNAIASNLEQDRIPKDIVLISDLNIESVFKDHLLKAITDHTGEKHTVIEFDPTLPQELETDTDPDTYLAVTSRFFHKLHGCNEIDGE